MTNAILARDDGYGILETATDVVFYAPRAVANTFSPHFVSHGTEAHDETHVFWSVPKSNAAGVHLITSITQIDVKGVYKLGPPPPLRVVPGPVSTILPTPGATFATPTGGTPPTSLSMETMLGLGGPVIPVPSVPTPASTGGSTFKRELIATHPSRAFELVNYSEKAFALLTAEEFGKANKAAFEVAKGKFNERLEHYLSGARVPGWIFAKSTVSAVQMLSQLSGADLHPYMSGVIARDWSRGDEGPSVGVFPPGPAIVSMGAPVRTQLQAIAQNRTVPTVVSELLGMLARTTEIGELEIPHPAGEVRRVIWGPTREVTERLATVQRDHLGAVITTEMTAIIREAHLVVITWSDDS